MLQQFLLILDYLGAVDALHTHIKIVYMYASKKTKSKIFFTFCFKQEIELNYAIKENKL